MSWSLDVFSPQSEQVTQQQLAEHLASVSPPLVIASPRVDSQATADENKVWPWQTLALADSGGIALADLLAIPFAVEREADPQMMAMFEADIAASDAEDGEIDEEYTSRLRQMLEQARWHYTVSVRQNDRPEQERAVVQAAHALAQSGGGVVHDPQSGAWMDSDLFENLLDAYGVSDSV